MVELNKLSKPALSAAMRGGTDQWGTSANSQRHIRYAEEVSPKSRRRCKCGCNRRATRRGMCNGICLRTGCEMSIMRWVRACNVAGPLPACR